MRGCARRSATASRRVVTQRTLQQVVTAERAEFTDAMMKTARPLRRRSSASSWSMCASPRSNCRNRSRSRCSSGCARRSRPQAAKLRAEGVEASDRIRGEANKETTEILADAARQAGETRGQGDAAASEVYANSYSKNPEFYSFYRSMQSYRGRRRHAGRPAGDPARQRVLQVLQQTATAGAALTLMEIGLGRIGALSRAVRSHCTSCSRGILPFLNPGATKRLMAKLSQTEPAQLRWGGLISMIVGLALLMDGTQWVRIWS